MGAERGPCAYPGGEIWPLGKNRLRRHGQAQGPRQLTPLRPLPLLQFPSLDAPTLFPHPGRWRFLRCLCMGLARDLEQFLDLAPEGAPGLWFLK
jgi:hypothetical protein